MRFFLKTPTRSTNQCLLFMLLMLRNTRLSFREAQIITIEIGKLLFTYRKEGSMINTIGFIGLGIMGKPMATNLIKAGYQLTVHDINRKPVQDLVAMGAEQAFSPEEAAGPADAVFTSLPNDQIVEQVATGKDGVIEGMKTGGILVDMSTISPTTTKRIARELKSKGMEMLDAPVSGGEVGAVNAALAIMVGGKQEVFEEVLPVLEKLGNKASGFQTLSLAYRIDEMLKRVFQLESDLE